MKKSINLIYLATLLTACVTIENDKVRMHQAALYGLTSAATCAMIGAVTAPDGKGTKYAKNAAAVCGAIGSIAGSVVENNVDRLARDIKVLNPQVTVTKDKINRLTIISMSENLIMLNVNTINPDIYQVLQRIARYLRNNPMVKAEIYSYVHDQHNELQNLNLAKQEAEIISNYLRNKIVHPMQLSVFAKGSQDKAKNYGNRIEILLR